MRTNTLARLCEAVRLAVYNTSSDPNLQQKLSGYGFTPKRVQEGKVLLERVHLMKDTQKEHYTGSLRMSGQIEQDGQAAREVFKKHVAIARTVFSDEPLVLQELDITKLSDGQWGWVEQAIEFYRQAPQYSERLQEYGASGLPRKLCHVVFSLSH